MDSAKCNVLRMRCAYFSQNEPNLPCFFNMQDRKSTRLNSSHLVISYAVFCLKKKTTPHILHSASTTRRPSSSVAPIISCTLPPTSLSPAPRPTRHARLHTPSHATPFVPHTST